MPNDSSPQNNIYSRDTLEFLTVAKQFCAFIENTEGMNRNLFVDTMLKLLPLMYLKASMIENPEHEDGVYPETYVTEEGYEIVRLHIATLMGEMDDYLEVFLDDMAYSDKPILSTISENIADIYQDIRDFVFAFQIEYEDNMREALAVCIENFGALWGQKLVNAMRALHSAKQAIKSNCNDDNCECHVHHKGHNN